VMINSLLLVMIGLLSHTSLAYSTDSLKCCFDTIQQKYSNTFSSIDIHQNILKLLNCISFTKVTNTNR
jgi:hypothetical protein